LFQACDQVAFYKVGEVAMLVIGDYLDGQKTSGKTTAQTIAKTRTMSVTPMAKLQ
jgi:hypothetical protein